MEVKMLESLLQQLKKLLDHKNYSAVLHNIKIIIQLLQLYNNEQLRSISALSIQSLVEIFFEAEKNLKNKEFSIKICQLMMVVLNRFNTINNNALATAQESIYKKLHELSPQLSDSAKSQSFRNNHLNVQTDTIQKNFESELLALIQLEKAGDKTAIDKQWQKLNLQIIEFYRLITQLGLSCREKQIQSLTAQQIIDRNNFITISLRQLRDKIETFVNLNFLDEARELISIEITSLAAIDLNNLNLISAYLHFINSNQIFRQSEQYQPLIKWRQCRENALRIYHNTSASFTEHSSIIKFQQQLTLDYIQLLQEILKQSIALLGVTPTNFCIIGLGRMCRKDASPNFPIRIQILVEKKDLALFEFINNYLLAIQISFLAFKKSHLPSTGLHLLSIPKIYSVSSLSSDGIYTVDEYLKIQNEMTSSDATELYPEFLSGDMDLFNECTNKLHALNFTNKTMTISTSVKALTSKPWHYSNLESQQINISSELIEPFTNAILFLKRFYGIKNCSANHPLLLIKLYVEKKYWTAEFGRSCEDALTLLYRTQLQFTKDTNDKIECVQWNKTLSDIEEEVFKPFISLLNGLIENKTYETLLEQLKKCIQEGNFQAVAFIIQNIHSMIFTQNDRDAKTQPFSSKQLSELIKIYQTLIGNTLFPKEKIFKSIETLINIVSHFLPHEKPRSELRNQYLELLMQAGRNHTAPLLEYDVNQPQIIANKVDLFLQGLTNFINAYHSVDSHVPMMGQREQNNKLSKLFIEKTITDTLVSLQKRLKSAQIQIPLNSSSKLVSYATTIIETNNTNFLPPDIWMNAIRKSEELYKTIYNLYISNTIIEEIHRFISTEYKNFTINLLKDIAAVLNIDFETLLLIFQGSLLRGDPSIDSDIEVSLIKKNQHNPIFDKNIHDLLVLWRAVMSLIGGKTNYSGFHIDGRGFPVLNLVRPDDSNHVYMVNSFIRYITEDQYEEDYTRLYSGYLIGNRSLYDELSNYLPAQPNDAMIEKFSIAVKTSFTFSFWHPAETTKKHTSVKEAYLQPLSLGITLLSFRYGLNLKNNFHPLALIKQLKERGLIHSDFATLCEQALRYLYRLRLQEQLIDHGFKITPENDKDNRLTQIIELVLKPLEILLEHTKSQKLLTALSQYNPQYFATPNGRRGINTQEKIDWHISIKTALIEQKPDEKLPKIKIKTAEGCDGFLPAEIVKYLIDSGKMDRHGKFIIKAKDNSDIKGNHNVYRITTGKGTVYNLFFFKLWPEMPGIEFAAGSLTRLLFGRGMPWVEVGRFEIDKDIYPVLISQGIEGETLEKWLKDNPNKSPKFDELLMGEGTIIDIVEGSEDKKGDNIVAEADKITRLLFTPLRPVPVDNDRSFYPALLQNENSITVLLKSLNLCADEAGFKIHPIIIENLLSINVYELLKEWLKDVDDKDKKIRALFSDKEMQEMFKEETVSGILKKMGVKAEIPEQSVLPIPLRDKLLPALYVKLCTIQKILKNYRAMNKSITYLQLLGELEPYLARYYQELIAKYKTLKERFDNGPGTMYGQGKVGQTQKDRLKTLRTVPQTLQTMHGKPVDVKALINQKNLLAKEHAAQLDNIHLQYTKVEAVLAEIKNGQGDFIQKLNQIGSDELKAKIINQIDFSTLKVSTEALTEVMEKINFTYLRLTHLNITTIQLSRILKNSANLRALTIRNAPQVAADLWPNLSKYCPFVEKIHLSDLPILNWAGDNIRLSALTEVFINNCPNLELLEISSPSLKILKVNECPVLFTESLLSLLKSTNDARTVRITRCAKVNTPAIGRELFKKGLDTRVNSHLLIKDKHLDIRELILKPERIAEILLDHPEVDTVIYSGSNNEVAITVAEIAKYCSRVPNFVSTESCYEAEPREAEIKISINKDTWKVSKGDLVTQNNQALIEIDNTKNVRIYDFNRPAGKELVKTIGFSEKEVDAIANLPNGNIVIGRHNIGGDKYLYIIDCNQPNNKEIILRKKYTGESISHLCPLSNEKIAAVTLHTINLLDINNSLILYSGNINDSGTIEAFKPGGRAFEKTTPDETNRFTVIPKKYGSISIIKTYSDNCCIIVSEVNNIKSEQYSVKSYLILCDFNRPLNYELTRVIEGHNSRIDSLLVLPEKRILSGSGKNSLIKTEKCEMTIKLWDLRKPSGQECIKTIPVDNKVSSFLSLPDGKIACILAYQILMILDLSMPDNKEIVFVHDFKKQIGIGHLLTDGRFLSIGAAEFYLHQFPNLIYNFSWISLFRKNFTLSTNRDKVILKLIDYMSMSKQNAELALKNAEVVLKTLFHDQKMRINLDTNNMQIIFYCPETSSARSKIMKLIQALHDDIKQPVNTVGLLQNSIFNAGNVSVSNQSLPVQVPSPYIKMPSDEIDDDELPPDFLPSYAGTRP